MAVLDVGAVCFGVVVGWVTSRTLRRSTPGGLTDIATVIGSVGGAAITGLFKPSENSFGLYCIGLAGGFFLYLVLAVATSGRAGIRGGDWLGSELSQVRASDGSQPANTRPNLVG
jgi:uncharacterized membrane protein YeaQ/YmgE (transglycosylase-associated protein family)